MSGENGSVLSIFAVRPSFLGGNESYARELSRQLDRQGWKSILCFGGELPSVARRFLDLPNVELDVLDAWSGEYQMIRQLRRALVKWRPKILHLHYTNFIAPYYWIAKMHGVEKIFITDHGSRPEDYTSQQTPLWKRAVAKAITHPVTGVMSVSDYCCQTMKAHGFIPPQRVFRVYNGVALFRVAEDRIQGVKFRRAHRIPSDAILATNMSWMIPEKGVADFLEAGRAALSEQPRMHFALVGEGEQLPEFVALAERLGMSDHVTFTGRIEDPFEEGVFAATDMLCQFSRWNEAFGWSMAEAMAYGKPVIATRVGGIPEVVLDGVTGILVEPRNCREMTQAMLRLAGDSALRYQMGVAGRRRVDEQFEMTANVARVLQIYGVASAASAGEQWAFQKAAGSRS